MKINLAANNYVFFTPVMEELAFHAVCGIAYDVVSLVK